MIGGSSEAEFEVEIENKKERNLRFNLLGKEA